ncbi:MAG: hypothetical protein AAF614_17270 [Chloroflexota bacterium]
MNDRYQAYLVRFNRSDQSESWRVTLQDVHTKKQHCFAREVDLFLFLLDRLSSSTPSSSQSDTSPKSPQFHE